MLDVVRGEVARRDAMFAAQDRLQDEHRALLEALTHVRALGDLPALGLRERGRGDGRGEGVKMHLVKQGVERAQWQEPGAVETGEPMLPARLQEIRVQHRGRCKP